MHDPDVKCRHFGILWHFGIFAKKSNNKSNPIFPILTDFFRLLDPSRLQSFRFYSSSTYTKSMKLKSEGLIIQVKLLMVTPGLDEGLPCFTPKANINLTHVFPSILIIKIMKMKWKCLKKASNVFTSSVILPSSSW